MRNLVDVVEASKRSIRKIFEDEARLTSQAWLFHASDRVSVISMPTLLMDGQRKAIQVSIQGSPDPVAIVVHAAEMWYVVADTQAQVDEAREAQRKQVLHEHPDRREMVMIFVETPAPMQPLMSFRAVITRDADGKPSLGEWEDGGAQLPYPGFKRYFDGAPRQPN